MRDFNNYELVHIYNKNARKITEEFSEFCSNQLCETCPYHVISGITGCNIIHNYVKFTNILKQITSRLTDGEIHKVEQFTKIVNQTAPYRAKLDIVNFYSYSPADNSTDLYCGIFDDYEKRLADNLNMSVNELNRMYEELITNWSDELKGSDEVDD